MSEGEVRVLHAFEGRRKVTQRISEADGGQREAGGGWVLALSFLASLGCKLRKAGISVYFVFALFLEPRTVPGTWQVYKNILLNRGEGQELLIRDTRRRGWL